MPVSRNGVVPTSVERFDDLPREWAVRTVEVRVCEDWNDVRDAGADTVHASGIGLRNSRSWRSNDR